MATPAAREGTDVIRKSEMPIVVMRVKTT